MEKAKKRLTTDEINRRHNTGACVNCGEVGHLFKDCPKPKPRLLESGVDITIYTSRTHISELLSVTYESCIINLNPDYAIDSTKHHLNDALVIRRKLVNNSSTGCALERTLKTSVYTT